MCINIDVYCGGLKEMNECILIFSSYFIVLQIFYKIYSGDDKKGIFGMEKVGI